MKSPMFCGGAASVNFYSSDNPLPVHAWEAKLAATSVLVMTAQILLNLLRAGSARLPQIAFLVFDECHHAQQAKDHPYTQIARVYLRSGSRRRSWGSLPPHPLRTRWC